MNKTKQIEVPEATSNQIERINYDITAVTYMLNVSRYEILSRYGFKSGLALPPIDTNTANLILEDLKEIRQSKSLSSKKEL